MTQTEQGITMRCPYCREKSEQSYNFDQHHSVYKCTGCGCSILIKRPEEPQGQKAKEDKAAVAHHALTGD